MAVDDTDSSGVPSRAGPVNMVRSSSSSVTRIGLSRAWRISASSMPTCGRSARYPAHVAKLPCQWLSGKVTCESRRGLVARSHHGHPAADDARPDVEPPAADLPDHDADADRAM